MNLVQELRGLFRLSSRGPFNPSHILLLVEVLNVHPYLKGGTVYRQVSTTVAVGLLRHASALVTTACSYGNVFCLNEIGQDLRPKLPSQF